MIIDNLYLGSYQDASNIEYLTTNNITHIVNASQLSNRYPEKIIYHTIDIDDDKDANIDKYFTECSRFIHNIILTNGKVLVHCFAGKSRSPTIVIAYLVMKKLMSLTNAYNLVKKCRPQIDINSGFLKQLEKRFDSQK